MFQDTKYKCKVIKDCVSPADNLSLLAADFAA